MADWKDIVRSVAPGIATVLSGGNPLIGTGVKFLADKLLGKPDATQDQVQAVIEKGLSIDDLAKLRQIDNEFKLQLEEKGIKLKELEIQREQAFLVDVQDARKANAQNDRVFWLGVIILATFALVIATVFWIGYRMLTGGLTIKDVGVVAAVFSLLGSVVGYAAANAQQVVGFFFGSSMGSGKKSDDMADAVKALAGSQK